MYWSEYDGITGSILKASMTGEGKHYLVNKIGRVISITLDYDSDLIYWITLTPNGGFIESIDLAGRRQNKIISAPFGFPSSLTYFKVKKLIDKYVIYLFLIQIFTILFRVVYFGWIGQMEHIFKSIFTMVQ